MRKNFKKVLSFAMATAMVVGTFTGVDTASAGVVSATMYNGDKMPAAYKTAPYFAYICFQTSNYNYRDPFDADTYGVINTKAQQEALAKENLPSFAWNKQFFYRVAKGTATKKTEFRSLAGKEAGSGDQYTIPEETTLTLGNADFSSPEVTYDGTYTVSMSNFRDEAFKYDYGFRMLYADTTIPYSAGTIQFTNVSLKIDDVEVYTAPTGVIRNKKDSGNTYQLVVANEYGYSGYGYKGQKENAELGDAVPDPVWEAAKTTGTINMPKKSISITFTISGLGAAPPGYVAKNDNASAASTAAIAAQQTTVPTEAAVTSMKKGKTFTAGNYTYKVTKAAEKSGKATVAVKSVKKAATKKASLSVPATVKDKNKFAYKVTSIGKSAFTKCKKLKKVTLGKNIKNIDKSAFKGCKKLATVKANSKLKIAKGAFKGCSSKLKVTGKSAKANKKAINKAK